MGKVKDFLLDELKTVLFVTGYFLSWFVVIGALKSEHQYNHRSVRGSSSRPYPRRRMTGSPFHTRRSSLRGSSSTTQRTSKIIVERVCVS